MQRRRWNRVGWVCAAAALTAGLTSCSSQGDLSIDNESAGAVTVLTGDQELDIDAWGGVSLLDYGCTPGDVTVKFATSEAVVVPGPVCPEQTIVVHDGTVELLGGAQTS